MVKVAVGDQQVLDAIQFDPAGLDILEKLDVRISAPCIQQRGTVIRTNNIDRRIFRGGKIAPSHLINIIRYLLISSLGQSVHPALTIRFYYLGSLTWLPPTAIEGGMGMSRRLNVLSSPTLITALSHEVNMYP
jgi:hypothetical protein